MAAMEKVRVNPMYFLAGRIYISPVKKVIFYIPFSGITEAFYRIHNLHRGLGLLSK